VRFGRAAVFFACLTQVSPPTLGQTPRILTLTQAEALAVSHHPKIRSSGFTARASEAVVREVRSAYYPTLTGYLTGAGAERDSVIGAGALTTSSLSSRVGSGLGLSQIVTDFGRTAKLTEAAKLRASAQGRLALNTRAQVLLEVIQAYFQTLGERAVLKAAQGAVENRRLILRQVRALAENSLRSTLDLSFAEIAVSEAELQLYRSENAVRAAQARLSAALGSEHDDPVELVDEPLPAELNPDVDGLIAQAFSDRPDLAALSFNCEAAIRFADAEKKLRMPTVSLAGVAGGIPAHDPPLRGTYSAAGVNISIPVLNGGLFAARRSEAELRAQAAGEDVKDLMTQIARDVRVTWLEANNAFRRLDVTSRLVQQANEALRLSQARYDLGLGTIVELNQAQLSQLSAQIAAASAKYDYLIRRAALDFARGVLQ
jgi:outer membrane protein